MTTMNGRSESSEEDEAPKFKKGQEVWCKFYEQFYKARILKVGYYIAGEQYYTVHYIKFSKKYDEPVKEARLLSINAKNNKFVKKYHKKVREERKKKKFEKKLKEKILKQCKELSILNQPPYLILQRLPEPKIDVLTSEIANEENVVNSHIERNDISRNQPLEERKEHKQKDKINSIVDKSQQISNLESQRNNYSSNTEQDFAQDAIKALDNLLLENQNVINPVKDKSHFTAYECGEVTTSNKEDVQLENSACLLNSNDDSVNKTTITINNLENEVTTSKLDEQPMLDGQQNILYVKEILSIDKSCCNVLKTSCAKESNSFGTTTVMRKSEESKPKTYLNCESHSLNADNNNVDEEVTTSKLDDQENIISSNNDLVVNNSNLDKSENFDEVTTSKQEDCMKLDGQQEKTCCELNQFLKSYGPLRISSFSLLSYNSDSKNMDDHEQGENKNEIHKSDVTLELDDKPGYFIVPSEDGYNISYNKPDLEFNENYESITSNPFSMTSAMEINNKKRKTDDMTGGDFNSKKMKIFSTDKFNKKSANSLKEYDSNGKEAASSLNVTLHDKMDIFEHYSKTTDENDKKEATSTSLIASCKTGIVDHLSRTADGNDSNLNEVKALSTSTSTIISNHETEIGDHYNNTTDDIMSNDSSTLSMIENIYSRLTISSPSTFEGNIKNFEDENPDGIMSDDNSACSLVENNYSQPTNSSPVTIESKLTNSEDEKSDGSNSFTYNTKPKLKTEVHYEKTSKNLEDANTDGNDSNLNEIKALSTSTSTSVYNNETKVGDLCKNTTYESNNYLDTAEQRLRTELYNKKTSKNFEDATTDGIIFDDNCASSMIQNNYSQISSPSTNEEKIKNSEDEKPYSIMSNDNSALCINKNNYSQMTNSSSSIIEEKLKNSEDEKSDGIRSNDNFALSINENNYSQITDSLSSIIKVKFKNYENEKPDDIISDDNCVSSVIENNYSHIAISLPSTYEVKIQNSKDEKTDGCINFADNVEPRLRTELEYNKTSNNLEDANTDGSYNFANKAEPSLRLRTTELHYKKTSKTLEDVNTNGIMSSNNSDLIMDENHSRITNYSPSTVEINIKNSEDEKFDGGNNFAHKAEASSSFRTEIHNKKTPHNLEDSITDGNDSNLNEVKVLSTSTSTGICNNETKIGDHCNNTTNNITFPVESNSLMKISDDNCALSMIENNYSQITISSPLTNEIKIKNSEDEKPDGIFSNDNCASSMIENNYSQITISSPSTNEVKIKNSEDDKPDSIMSNDNSALNINKNNYSQIGNSLSTLIEVIFKNSEVEKSDGIKSDDCCALNMIKNNYSQITISSPSTNEENIKNSEDEKPDGIMSNDNSALNINKNSYSKIGNSLSSLIEVIFKNAEDEKSDGIMSDDNCVLSMIENNYSQMTISSSSTNEVKIKNSEDEKPDGIMSNDNSALCINENNYSQITHSSSSINEDKLKNSEDEKSEGSYNFGDSPKPRLRLRTELQYKKASKTLEDATANGGKRFAHKAEASSSFRTKVHNKKISQNLENVTIDVSESDILKESNGSGASSSSTPLSNHHLYEESDNENNGQTTDDDDHYVKNKKTTTEKLSEEDHNIFELFGCEKYSRAAKLKANAAISQMSKSPVNKEKKNEPGKRMKNSKKKDDDDHSVERMTWSDYNIDIPLCVQRILIEDKHLLEDDRFIPHVPAKPSVNSILQDFASKFPVCSETLEMMFYTFDSTLDKWILHSLEKPTYCDILQKYPPNHSMSKIYGLPHLLRFLIKLPKMLHMLKNVETNFVSKAVHFVRELFIYLVHKDISLNFADYDPVLPDKYRRAYYS